MRSSPELQASRRAGRFLDALFESPLDELAFLDRVLAAHELVAQGHDAVARANAPAAEGSER